MKNLTFKIYTLGCKVNQYDSKSLGVKLTESGMKQTDEDAQLAIINTCSVTKTAIRKDKRMINKARKENPDAFLVVMGCWPEVNGVKHEEFDVGFVWGTGKLDNLVAKISNFQFPISKQFPISNFQIINSENERSRYFIKIQDGCEQFCTYCVIPYARGKLFSRPAEEIINEIKSVVEKGYREIIFCGIHLGLYGKDSFSAEKKYKIKNKELTLTGLLKKSIKTKDLGRIRLSSIEVTEITDELIELMAEGKKICRHLHIPLQSGCDKILKSMNRPYDTKYFSEKITKLRFLMPDIAITTDIIIGFPGETDQDFNKTLKFIKKIKFSKLHVFPFSAHPKAPAGKFKDQVDKNTIKNRTEILQQLSNVFEEQYRKKFNGKLLDVVIENERNNKIIAKTQYHFDLRIEKSKVKERVNNCRMAVGELIRIKMSKDDFY